MADLLEKIEQATLIAITDPKSPYFKQAMTELHAMALQKTEQRKEIDNILLQILTDEELEKNLLVKEQLKSARETEQKYLAGITAQQEKEKKEHAAAIESMELAPKKLIDYLSEQNTTLDNEIKELQLKLINLKVDQQAIQKAWAKQQTATTNQFIAALASQNMSLVSLDGKAIQLDDPEIAANFHAHIASSSPVDLFNRAPHLAEYLAQCDESQRQERVEIMGINEVLMKTFKLAKFSINPNSEINEGIEIPPSYMLKMIRINKDPNRLFADVLLNNTNRATSIHSTQEAFKTTESYRTTQAQITLNQDKINTNEKIIDRTKVEADAEANTSNRMGRS